MTAYVLDSSALLAYVDQRESAGKVAHLLKSAIRGEAEILMSAVNYGEVYSVALRERGRDRALATLSMIRPLPIRFVDATPDRALHAAEVKIKYKLYYADSFAAALAMEYNAKLVTSDSDFRRLGHGFPIAWLKS
jgi:predicted nucleic acid-binding protein